MTRPIFAATSNPRRASRVSERAAGFDPEIGLPRAQMSHGGLDRRNRRRSSPAPIRRPGYTSCLLMKSRDDGMRLLPRPKLDPRVDPLPKSNSTMPATIPRDADRMNCVRLSAADLPATCAETEDQFCRGRALRRPIRDGARGEGRRRVRARTERGREDSPPAPQLRACARPTIHRLIRRRGLPLPTARQSAPFPNSAGLIVWNQSNRRPPWSSSVTGSDHHSSASPAIVSSWRDIVRSG